MANKTYFKNTIEKSVYDAAIERINLLYDRFDKVVVSFSGGKDSTVCLNLCLEVARARGALPLDVYFWDEEAIHPETIEYVERVRALPDVRLRWLCVPVMHRNACSRRQPYWYCWDPEEKDKWVRPMPEFAETTVPRFQKGLTIPELAPYVYGPEHGTIADVRGIRADESIRRYRSVANKLKEGWIGAARDGYNYPVSPIYDWSAVDVWTAPRLYGWDYNRAYDLMALAGKSVSQQRVCPPYGEEPLNGLWMYAVCWPDLWHKMINRVHGAATAARYAQTEIYGFGRLEAPPGMTFREWLWQLLELYPKDLKAQVASGINAVITAHKNKTNRPIPERAADADLLTGVSWEFLANIANRGDLKKRRAGQRHQEAIAARNRKGVTIEEVQDDETATRY